MHRLCGIMHSTAVCVCVCMCAVSQKAATVAIKDAPLVAHVAIVAAGRNSSCKQQQEQEPRMEPPSPVCAVIKFFAFII